MEKVHIIVKKDVEECAQSRNISFKEALSICVPACVAGTYPALYQDEQGNILCAVCARKVLRDGFPVHGSIYYEGPSLDCDECGEEIESAYGDPWEEEEEEEE